MKKLILSNLSNLDINETNNIYLGPWCFLKKNEYKYFIKDNNFNSNLFSNYNRKDSKYLIEISEIILIKL